MFCCVIAASDAFLLAYLSVNSSVFVHDWEELLHTLEKTKIVQSYCKVFKEICVIIVERD